MTSPAGLLSLHPDRAGAIHGNVVTGDGVRHLALGALEPPLVDLPGSVVGETALCRALERLLPPGEARAVRVVRVTDALDVSVVELEALRRDARAWELRDSGVVRSVRVGDRGAPAEGPGDARWPLETVS